MHDDVKTPLASGTVDPKRVANLGGSHSPGRERTRAVPLRYYHAGVFDWEQLINDNKSYKYDSPNYGRLLLKFRDPAQEKSKFDSISLLRHLDRVHVPVFVAHVDDDPELRSASPSA